jgi:hypothetical protein
MPEFDANEDHVTLPGPGQDDAPDPAEQQPPTVRRARDLAAAHSSPLDSAATRARAALTARRRRAERFACPLGRRAWPLRTLPRRRRLWTQCHGRPPGSPS